MSGGRGYSNNGRGNGRGYGRFNNNNNNSGRGRGFRRNRFNNNNNNRSNKNNNVPNESLPPLTYDTKPDKQIRTKVEWQHGRNSNIRTESEKIAVYEDTAKEDYLRTLAAYREILNDYPYLKEDEEAATACRIFKKCLKGAARDSVSQAISETNEGTIDTNEALEDVIWETTHAILGNYAHDKQVEYLKATKKPRKLTVDEWLRRIRNINTQLENMDREETKLTDKELIKEVILPNVPASIKVQLKMQGGRMLTWSRVNDLLTHLFDLVNIAQSKKKNGGEYRKGRNNDGQNSRNGRNRGNFNNNDNNGTRNDNEPREETYQQRRTQERSTRNDESSYYSDDDNREESNMMRAREMKKRKKLSGRPKEASLKQNVPL